MAVYTKLNDNKIEKILSYYDLGKLDQFKGIEEGIENFPLALQKLFTGGNTGKLIVKI